MLKKTIKYTDYDGNVREEDFYFNLNKSELIELSVSKDGGIETVLTRLIKQQNVKEILEIIQKLILKAYGEKSDDGKVLLKSDEISQRFKCTEAYNELFCDLAEDSKKALEFIHGLIPKDVLEKMIEAEKNQPQITDAQN